MPPESGISIHSSSDAGKEIIRSLSDARSEQAVTTADNAASGRANLKKGFIAKIPGAQKCAQSFKMHSSEILLQRRGKRADIPVLPTSFECSRRSVFTPGTGLLFTSYISGCSAFMCRRLYVIYRCLRRLSSRTLSIRQRVSIAFAVANACDQGRVWETARVMLFRSVVSAHRALACGVENEEGCSRRQASGAAAEQVLTGCLEEVALQRAHLETTRLESNDCLGGSLRTCHGGVVGHFLHQCGTTQRL